MKRISLLVVVFFAVLQCLALPRPVWEGVRLLPEGNRGVYVGWRNNIKYTIRYIEAGDRLTVVAGLENHRSDDYKVAECERLILGIDNRLDCADSLDNRYFPTMMRCEKTHFWGYFESHSGAILSICSPDAVASWKLDYIGNGHNIATTFLDLMHCKPLPPRHPQGLDVLKAGEKRTWRIIMQPAMDLKDVLSITARNCQAPALGIDRTTVAPGDEFSIDVYGKKFFDNIAITDANGNNVAVGKPVVKDSTVTYTVVAPHAVGNLTIIATGNGHRSEALVHVRKPWGWYMQAARSEALRMQVKAQSHREGWMGLITAYLAQAYYPDSLKLRQTEAEYAKLMRLMTDSTGDFRKIKQTWRTRPQNTSWMIDLMNARYAATGDIRALETSAAWADRLIRGFQMPDGAFKGYTALTLGSKFLRDLMAYELPLSLADSTWRGRYRRHKNSLERAAQNILKVRDMGETEGEPTYEDNQAGSAWSLLAMHAMQEGDGKKGDFLKAALDVQRRHECLTQALIPDGRMRGGTLRFWESQYDILTPPNMMSSPHGWTMRSQFGALYLYLLTGNTYYLDVAYNAMGACAQAIDEGMGTLRWAFIQDPYVDAQVFEQDPANPGKGIRRGRVIGEQWMPMISDWWRIPDGELAMLPTHNEWDGMQQGTQGWSCDNDVHFHFITLADEFLPNAFVVERADGSIRTYNCRVSRKGGSLIVTPAEDVVTRVHFNLKHHHSVKVVFGNETVKRKLPSGMAWVSTKSERVAHAYLKK